jgi:hypothetical protein
MNQAHGYGFPNNDKYWIGTYFEFIPDGMKIYEIAGDDATLCIKISARDCVVNQIRKRFPRPKRRMVFFYIPQGVYSNYLKNYKGKEPFSQSPSTHELIELGFNTQQYK